MDFVEPLPTSTSRRSCAVRLLLLLDAFAVDKQVER